MTARNRPRASLAKEDIGDEQNLWNSIVDTIKKCSSVNRRYSDISERLIANETRIKENEAVSSVSDLEELETLHRSGLRAAEEEIKILHEEPDDLIKNLETLISVRAAFETEIPPATRGMAGQNVKPRNLKRKIENSEGAGDVSPAPTPEVQLPPSGTIKLTSKSSSRSGSVSAGGIKSEADIDVKGVVSEKPKFSIGAEVFYRNKGKDKEGEGILGHVTTVTGEGKQRRYVIQDSEPEPDENGAEPSPFRAPVSSLVAIPASSSGLPELPKGRQVLALYPQTTTFYKAELVGMRNPKMCRLRFEGEEEKDKEQDVERRYVLEPPK